MAADVENLWSGSESRLGNQVHLGFSHGPWDKVLSLPGLSSSLGK